MREYIGKICMVLGGLLLVAAVALFTYNQIENKKANRFSDDVLGILNQTVDGKLAEGIDENAIYEEYQQVEADIAAANKSEELEPLRVMEIDGIEYVGTIIVPSINIELPVISEWDYDSLKKAPCRYNGTVAGKNLVICAHNYRSHFGGLKTLKEGDSVYFVDVDGYSNIYKVAGVEVLQPTAIEEMTESGYDLTLFTCTYGGRTRLAVRCSLL